MQPASSAVADAKAPPPPMQPSARKARSVPYVSQDGSIRADADFESGNGRVVSASAQAGAGGESTLFVEIEPDTNAKDYQWFHLRVQCAAGRRLCVVITNAKCAMPLYQRDWTGYRAYWTGGDPEEADAWETAESTYNANTGWFSFRLETRSEETQVAFFPPYSLARAEVLAERAARSGRCSAATIGFSVEGRPITELHFRAPGPAAELRSPGRKHFWVIARQHSGESMASHFAEGLVSRLLDEEDADAGRVLAAADVHVVPVVNPDGVAWGNLRYNLCGLDLNRQWAEPDPALAPEVACVRGRLEETGAHFLLDAHGDEAIPYVFVVPSCSEPGADAPRDERLGRLTDLFKAEYGRINACFQDSITHLIGVPLRFSYANKPPGLGMSCPPTTYPGVAANHVARRHGALAVTLEMPFKEAANEADALRGFGAERCRRLGADLVAVLAALAGEL
eukprot:tig00020616_g12257.t1